MAQNGIKVIVEEYREGQRRTDSKDTRRIIIFLIAFVGYAVWSTILQQRIESRIGQPLPAVVHLLIAAKDENPVLCPGDTLEYTVSRDVDDFFVGRAVVVVKNAVTERQEMSGGTDVIYDVGQVTLSSNWQIPALLPATLTKPVRPWMVGQFKREIAIASYGANYDTEPAFVNFRIGQNCPGVEG